MGITQRLVLVERKADVADGLLINFGPEQAPVSGLPRLVIPPKLEEEGMRHEIPVGLPQGIVPITAPAVMRRIINHSGAHRVEFDVALTAKQIGFSLD